MGNSEQRNMTFLVWLGKTLSHTLQMLRQVHGENMLRTCIYYGHKMFKDGGEKVRDDSRSGRPSTSRTKVNRKSNDVWLLEVSWIWKTSVFGRSSPKIWVCGCLHKNNSKTAEWWSERAQRADVSRHQYASSNWTRFLLRFCCRWDLDFKVRPEGQAPDESVEVFNIMETEEIKTKSKVKVILITFFLVRGISHCELLPRCLMFSQQVCQKILWRMLRSMQRSDENCGRENRGCFTIITYLLPQHPQLLG